MLHEIKIIDLYESDPLLKFFCRKLKKTSNIILFLNEYPAACCGVRCLTKDSRSFINSFVSKDLFYALDNIISNDLDNFSNRYFFRNLSI